jgi:glycosyltransferase involved in cell wall biosynthesis
MSDVELIVSANGCTDNTEQYLNDLSAKFNSIGCGSHFKHIISSVPLGYSRANNVALNVASGDRIVLLNNDTILLPQERNTWLSKLEYQFMIDPRCGISAVSIGPSEPAGQDFAIFFCVMIDKMVFKSIGLLNEEYGKGGGEDTEFCIEAQRAGFTMRLAAEAVWDGSQFVGGIPIYHKGEGTMHDAKLVPDWNDVFLQNSLKLAKKYNRDWYRWRISNYCERAVYLKGDQVDVRETTRYCWASDRIESGSKVLEIGCSNGYGTQFLASDIDYTGLDYDKTIIEVAKDQNWAGNKKFINANMNDYDFGFYDTIIAFEVIEHIDNGLEIVEKLKKHCKQLLITVPRMEPPGFWGPHHKLHMLNEEMFPGFTFQYINENGQLLQKPDDGIINLMVCSYEQQ